MEELYVRVTEKTLGGKLDRNSWAPPVNRVHLGYGKYAAEGRNTGNCRRGKTSNFEGKSFISVLLFGIQCIRQSGSQSLDIILAGKL
jgi:hypothetical protein